MVKKAWAAQRDFVAMASACKKPDQAVLGVSGVERGLHPPPSSFPPCRLRRCGGFWEASLPPPHSPPPPSHSPFTFCADVVGESCCLLVVLQEEDKKDPLPAPLGREILADVVSGPSKPPLQ